MGTAVTQYIYFPSFFLLAFALSPLLFFFPFSGTYDELSHSCLYQPLDRSLVSLPPVESSQ